MYTGQPDLLPLTEENTLQTTGGQYQGNTGGGYTPNGGPSIMTDPGGSYIKVEPPMPPAPMPSVLVETDGTGTAAQLVAPDPPAPEHDEKKHNLLMILGIGALAYFLFK